MWTDTQPGRSRVLTARVPVACAGCGAEVMVVMIRRGLTNYCKACQKQRHAAKNLAEYHARRAAGMTPAAWKKPKKAKPADPLSSPGQHQSRKPTITILHDPSEWPMAAGALISQEEYYAGLRLGAFEPGTVFRMPGGWVEVAGWER